MKIGDFLFPKAVAASLQGTTKEEIIEEMVGLLVKAGAIEKRYKQNIIEVLLAREALGSTAIGQGIAIPHGKSEHIRKLTASFGISKKGVNFDSLDGEPAHIFFLLVAPIDSAGPHLKALARISRILKEKYLRESLKAAKDEHSILQLIHQEDLRIT